MQITSSISILLILFGALLLAPACKAGKTGESAKLRKKNARFLVKKLEEAHLDAEWMEARGRLKFKSDDLSIGLTTTIRLKRDSAIWMVAKKLSIEAARVLITKDSVYILNRLNKEYAVESLDFLAREYNLPASFTGLQDILLGNSVLLQKEGNYNVAIEKDRYRLSGKYDGLQTDYFLKGANYLLDEIRFEDIANDRSVQISLEDYKQYEGIGKFSYVRNLKMKSPDTGAVDVELKFSKVEINTPKSMPFEIPGSYSRM